MSMYTQSTPVDLTRSTLSDESIALTTCPRCGKPLPDANVACNQRSCRPAALRRVLFVPLAPVENEASSITNLFKATH